MNFLFLVISAIWCGNSFTDIPWVFNRHIHCKHHIRILRKFSEISIRLVTHLFSMQKLNRRREMNLKQKNKKKINYKYELCICEYSNNNNNKYKKTLLAYAIIIKDANYGKKMVFFDSWFRTWFSSAQKQISHKIQHHQKCIKIHSVSIWMHLIHANWPL